MQEPCILVLGCGGFVGAHLKTALLSRFGMGARLIFTSLAPKSPSILPLDIRNTDALCALIRAERPSHIINLVGIAAPSIALKNPDLSWELHAHAPTRLAQMLLVEAPECWLFHVSSGLIYGRNALNGEALDEKVALDPIGTYATTKAAGDLAVGNLAGEGLKCLRLRPFNHTGPGQSTEFAIPAFAAQLVNIRAQMQPPIIKVGNLSSVRDFLDVRDVVDAYVDLVICSTQLKSGAIYNIASGNGKSMRQILDQLIKLSGLDVAVVIDPERKTPSDLSIVVGTTKALQQATGWQPRRKLDETLIDVLQHFEREGTDARSESSLTQQVISVNL